MSLTFVGKKANMEGSVVGNLDLNAGKLPDGMFDAAIREVRQARSPLVSGHGEMLMFPGSHIGIFGEPGVGKSFLTIDLAVSVATGERFLGRFNTMNGPVIYLCPEGSSGIEQRIAAACQVRKLELPRGKLICDTVSVPFGEGREGTVHELITRMRLALNAEDPRLVIVDTLSRNIAGDSDTNRGMDAFVNDIQKLINYTGAAVLVVHHCGWDTSKARPRGGSSWYGALDTLIECKGRKAPNDLEIICRKQKDVAGFQGVKVGFKSVKMPDYDVSHEGELVHEGSSLACHWIGDSANGGREISGIDAREKCTVLEAAIAHWASTQNVGEEFKTADAIREVKRRLSEDGRNVSDRTIRRSVEKRSKKIDSRTRKFIHSV